MKSPATAINEQILQTLQASGVVYQIRQHEPVVTIADVERVLQVPLEVTVKALIVKTASGPVVAAIPGNRRLNKQKLAGVLGQSRKRLDLLRPEAVEKLIGLPIGAIPPFGLGLPVVLDSRLLQHERLYCGLGTNDQSLVIAAADLAQLAHANVSDISDEIERIC
ncbi:MAG: YbaK/EbsC family protein [bacterium]|nr:YbaK/EbsC family protein [bacterium]